MDGLVNLKTLILSFNEIEEIEGLNHNVKLEKLDLNHNFIRTIQNLQGLAQLTSLDLRSNWLTELQQIEHIEQHCMKLQELGLKCNPMANKQSYRIQVFKKLPQIKKLDGQNFSERDKESSDRGARELSLNIIVENLKN